MKRKKTFGGESHIGFQEALELQEGFVIKDDEVNVIQRHPFLCETIFDGIVRKPGIVLLTAETLFLRRRHHFPVAKERRRAVVIESGYA